MREVINRVIYDTEGEGVVRVYEHHTDWCYQALYCGKNGHWFELFQLHDWKKPRLSAVSRRKAQSWLEGENLQEALNKYFPLKEA